MVLYGVGISRTVTEGRTSEDWDLLVSFFPGNWQDLAAETGALRGLRKDKSPEKLLRTLLIHLGCGHSLRETVVRDRQASLADLSDVALLKRLRKSRDWLYALCVELFREHGIAVSSDGGFQVRVFDATTVQEPGRTGSLWRLHYSVRLPSLGCDFFKLTGTEGSGAGDYVLADPGYSNAAGIRHVATAGGHVTVRVNSGTLPPETAAGEPFDLLAAVETLKRPGPVGVWTARTVAKGGPPVLGRVCAVRKTNEAIAAAHAKIRKTGPAQAVPGAAGNPAFCTLRRRLHHLPPGGVYGGRRAGMVPPALAGRTGLQTLQVPGPARAFAQVR